MKRLCTLVVIGFVGWASSAEAQAQEITAAKAAAAIKPQRFIAPLTARFAENVNPQFFVNARQAALRNHHLVKAPPIQPALAPLVDLPANAMGTPTNVAPVGTAGGAITVTFNRPLSGSETNDITSTVLEPSGAISRDGVVIFTGNWFAAISKDSGQTFNYRNPYDVFSGGGSEGFCCDQVVLYDSSRDIMFWYLQGVQDGRANVGRLVFARGADIRNENWQYYDLTPGNIGGWSNEWFDFPELALGSRHLYISTNSFATKGTATPDDDSFARGVVIRLDLDQIAASAEIVPEFFASEEAFSLRPTHGATDTMYFGSHDFADFGRRILVFSWPQNAPTVSRRAVQVDTWSNAARDSLAKDGNQWLRRTDFRMTAAWIIGKEAGFAWSAAGVQPFKHPHIRTAILDVTSTGSTPVRQPHLWNDQYAFAYPAAYGASASSAAIAVQYGGGGQQGINPSHAVGTLRRSADGSYTWVLQGTAVGSNGPADGRWGDYLAVRPRIGQGWMATGYTLDGGPLARNVVPRVVFFDEAAQAPTAMAERSTALGVRAELEQLRGRIDVILRQLDGGGTGR
jgi:hypothetical protein